MNWQSDFNSLVDVSGSPIATPLSRRNFVKASVGLGFAAATLPICAQTVVHTDNTGLEDKKFSIDVDKTEVPVYMAKPKGRSNLPIVLVISEIFGLHEHIADVARRFAKRGYLAIAPDLFVRQGDATHYDNIATLLKDVIAKVPDAQVYKDLDASVAWAGEHGGNVQKLAVVGFCWGGRMVWMYAKHNPEVKAGVAWYGRLVNDSAPDDLTPQFPIDIAKDLTTPVLGLYGEKDSGISMESVEKMKAALANGKSHSEIVVYSDAGHGFHADYRSSYIAADAKDSWTRCLKWLKQHGVD